jgi:hypothetical protein
MNSSGDFDPIVEFTRPISFDRDSRVEGDSIRIAGDWCPGIAIARGAGTPRIWDKRAGYGLSGRTLVYMGADLSSFEVDVTVWTQTQVDEWKVFFKKYLEEPARPSPQALLTSANPFLSFKQPKALGVYSPFLAMLGITALVVEDVSQWEQHEDAESGMYGCTIKVIVWRPPVVVLARPTQKIPDAAKAAPTARDKAEEEIQKLQLQAKQLEDELAKKQAQ